MATVIADKGRPGSRSVVLNDRCAIIMANTSPGAPRRRLGAEPSGFERRHIFDGASVFAPDIARQREPGDLTADTQRLAFVPRRVAHWSVEMYVTCHRRQGPAVTNSFLHSFVHGYPCVHIHNMVRRLAVRR